MLSQIEQWTDTVGSRNQFGISALIAACQFGQIEPIRLLLDAGADASRPPAHRAESFLPMLASDLRCRESDVKRAAVALLAFNPDRASIVFRDPFADGESDSRTRNARRVEPFEDTKDALVVFSGDANSVVLDSQFREILVVLPDRYFDDRLPLRLAIFDAVAQQVLQKLKKMRAVYAKRSKIVLRDDRSSVRNRLLQRVHGFCENKVRISRRRSRCIETRGLRVRKKILHQLIDPASRVIYSRNKLLRVGRQSIAMAAIQ
jgi:hypothetical protein